MPGVGWLTPVDGSSTEVTLEVLRLEVAVVVAPDVPILWEARAWELDGTPQWAQWEVCLHKAPQRKK